MSTQTIELDQNDLDKTIAVLSSAKTLQLTRFERFSYRALIVSVDAAATCYLTVQVISIFNPWEAGSKIDDRPIVWIPLVITFLAILVGLVALALNIPLFLRTSRERRRLKELGLGSLTSGHHGFRAACHAFDPEQNIRERNLHAQSDREIEWTVSTPDRESDFGDAI
jgi:hypothetical protein